MSSENEDIQKRLKIIRQEFPILEECTYLISNSLGAVPRRRNEHWIGITDFGRNRELALGKVNGGTYHKG